MDSFPHIIGIAGKARSGKDTLAGLLVKHHGFRRDAFADGVRAAALALDPIVDMWDVDNSCSDPDCCGGPYPVMVKLRLSQALDQVGGSWDALKDAHEYEWDLPDEVRRTLQRIGTTVRETDPDFWIRPVLARAEDAWDAPTVVTWSGTTVRDFRTRTVVPDVRFRNEVDAIEAAGGLVVRVVRDGAGLSGEAASHASETELDGWDAPVTVENNGTLEDLARAATEVARLTL